MLKISIKHLNVKNILHYHNIYLKSDVILLSDILDIFNDSIHEERCILGIGFCDCLNKCALHDQWAEPKNLIQKMFKETTLDNLTNKGCKI